MEREREFVDRVVLQGNKDNFFFLFLFKSSIRVCFQENIKIGHKYLGGVAQGWHAASPLPYIVNRLCPTNAHRGKHNIPSSLVCVLLTICCIIGNSRSFKITKKTYIIRRYNIFM